MLDNENKKRGMLKTAFSKAVGSAFQKIQYHVTNYPSKTAASMGFLGDITFLYHALEAGNYLGASGAVAGAYACLHLICFGDPKILPAEKETYIEPQDHRSVLNWIKHPTQYPWEWTALVRAGYTMPAMLLGSVGVGSIHTTISVGELAYSSLALLGYGIKMGIAERPKGSVNVPDDTNAPWKKLYEWKAYVLENPNATAGRLWLAGLVPYFVDGVVQGDKVKMASAMFYFFPDILTYISSKRAQTLPQPPQP